MTTAGTDADTDSAFIRSLPKAELHVHLEGTLEPATALACGRRNGVSSPWRSEEELRAAYDFADLPAFLEVLFQVAGTLRQRQDFFDLAMDYLRRARADGVVRAEVFVGSQTFLDAGVPIGVILDGVLAAFREASEEWGIDAQLICTAQRHRAESTALELLDLIEPWREQVIGIGMGSAERGNPPSKFARFFAEAQRRGYRTTIHAGEDAPASYVVEALELGVDRIDHGLAVADDPGARAPGGRPRRTADDVPAVQRGAQGRAHARRPPAQAPARRRRGGHPQLRRPAVLRWLRRRQLPGERGGTGPDPSGPHQAGPELTDLLLDPDLTG